MEEMDELGPLLDIGEIGGYSASTNRNSRRSFYDQPRTLSEEDDTFGILSNPSHSGTKHESFNPSETPVSTGLLVEIDSSQSSNENSDIASQSRLQSSKINGTELGLSMQSSRGISVSSITNSSSRNFGNISHISSLTEQSSGRSLLLSDSVFSSQSTMENDPMNWDMIMNEAQILASTINKDPVKSKKGSLGNMSPYTVGLDSPLLDLEKEFCKPDEFLVPLTPDRSPPIKDLSTAIGQSNLAAEVSPPLKALPEHEIDGDQPTPKPAIHETPKNTNRPVNRSSRPRQLLAGHNKTPEKKTLQETNNSVEKQVKSKVQQSNVLRTSMTNPSLLVAQDQNVKKGQNINTSISHKPRLSLVERQSLSKPGTPVISRTMGTPNINNKINLKNVQSKINSGMPSTKGALNRTAPVKVQVASAKKALVPNSGRKMAPPSASKYAISSRPGSAIGMGPGSSSTSKKGPTVTPLTGQRAVLQRQGSNLSNLPPRRPSSTTPMKSRQSLSFVTPAPAAPKFTPSAPRSGLKPPTPSRLMAPKIRTPSAAMQQPKPTQQQNIIQKPKSRSSLRFSALPSPAVGGGLRVGNKENDSLVCSTPAVQLSSVRSGQQGSGSLPPHPRAGLPSPIHTKRRAV